MTKTTGRELHTRRETELRMPWELGVGLAVVEEMLEGDVSLEGSYEILSRNSMTWKQTS